MRETSYTSPIDNELTKVIENATSLKNNIKYD